MNTITVNLLTNGHGNYEVEDEDGNYAFYQMDTDCLALAQALGFGLSSVQVAGLIGSGRECLHPFTDGTIRCDECGIISTSFIEAAMNWLDDNEGDIEIPESAYDSIAWDKEEE